MDFFKKLFPISFSYVGEVSKLIIGIIIYVVIGIVGGVVINLAGLINLPLVGILLGLIGGLLDLYVTAGIVIAIFVQCKIIQ